MSDSEALNESVSLGDDGVFARSLGLLFARLAVFSSVFFLDLARIHHGALELLRLFDGFWDVSLALDLGNVSNTAPLLSQTLGVFAVGHLAAAEQTEFLAGSGFPYAQISIVGPAEDESSVHGESRGENTLHALRVIDVARVVALAVVPYAQRSVVRAGDQFGACRRKVDRHDGSNMVPVDLCGRVQMSHTV